MNMTRKYQCGIAAVAATLALAHGVALAGGGYPPEAMEGGQSSTAGQAAKQTKDTKATTGAQKVTPLVFMLVPLDIAAADTTMKTGCWAKVYSGENYAGDSLTLSGPISIANMSITGPFGLNWDDRVNSIEIGPKATVTVYDNQEFRDMVTEFKPGQKVPDVSRKLGFFDEFASIRINCGK